MGLHKEHLFDIGVTRHIWPILHTLIGVGNDILEYLIDIIESENQVVLSKEIHVKRELG